MTPMKSPNKQQESIEKAATWAATVQPLTQVAPNRYQHGVKTSLKTHDVVSSVSNVSNVSNVSSTQVPSTTTTSKPTTTTISKPNMALSTLLANQNCELSLVSYLSPLQQQQQQGHDALQPIGVNGHHHQHRSVAAAALFGPYTGTDDTFGGEIVSDGSMSMRGGVTSNNIAIGGSNGNVDESATTPTRSNASSVAALLRRFKPGHQPQPTTSSSSSSTVPHYPHFHTQTHIHHNHQNQHGRNQSTIHTTPSLNRHSVYEESRGSRSAEDLVRSPSTSPTRPVIRANTIDTPSTTTRGPNTNTNTTKPRLCSEPDSIEDAASTSPITKPPIDTSLETVTSTSDQYNITASNIDKLVSGQTETIETIRHLLDTHTRVTDTNTKIVLDAIRIAHQHRDDHDVEVLKEIRELCRDVSTVTVSNRESDTTCESEMVQKLVDQIKSIQPVLVDIASRSDDTTARTTTTLDIDTIREAVTQALIETNAKITALESTLTQSITQNQTSPTRAVSITDTGIDRPTKNLMLSINEKCIQITKHTDHHHQNIVSRITTLEERIVRTQGTVQSDQSDVWSRTTRLDKTMSEVKSDVVEMKEKVRQFMRDQSNTNRNVNALLQRVVSVVESMADTRNVSGAGVVANRGHRGDSECDRGHHTHQQQNQHHGLDDASCGTSISSVSAASYTDIVQGIDQIRQTISSESESTSARMTQLLDMFNILQEAHVQLSGKLCAALEHRSGDSNRVDHVDTTASVSGVGITMNALEEKIRLVDTHMQDISNAIKDLTHRVGAAPTTGTNASADTPPIMRLLESVHSTLVNYLPLDLEQRLSAIEMTVRDMRATAPSNHANTHPSTWTTTTKTTPTGSQPPSQAYYPTKVIDAATDPRILITWQQEIMSQNTSIMSSLDALHHAVSRLLEYVPQIKPISSSANTHRGMKETSTPGVSRDTDTDITTLIKQLKSIITSQCTNTNTNTDTTTLTIQQEDLRDQIKSLSEQKHTLMSEIKTLRAARSAHVHGLGLGFGVASSSSSSSVPSPLSSASSMATLNVSGSNRPSVVASATPKS